jgi:5-methylcytosine-specific restriction endonuclease McrA
MAKRHSLATRQKMSKAKRIRDKAIQIPQGHKWCSRCDRILPLEQFGRDRRLRQGKTSYCQDCRREIKRNANHTPLMEGEKACTSCGKLLPLTKFYKDKRSLDGRRSACKDCTKKGYKSRRRYEPINEGSKTCRLCERELPITKFHVQGNNLDGRSGICRDCAGIRNAEYYQATAEQQRENSRQWRRNNRAQRTTQRYKRRAILENAEGFCLPIQWEAIIAHYAPNGHCLCCGKKRKLTMDHVIPLTEGGTNWPGNIQPLCARCNSRKRTKSTDYRPDAGAYAQSLIGGRQ